MKKIIHIRMGHVVYLVDKMKPEKPLKIIQTLLECVFLCLMDSEASEASEAS